MSPQLICNDVYKIVIHRILNIDADISSCITCYYTQLTAIGNYKILTMFGLLMELNYFLN